MLKRSPWPVILQIIPELSAGGAERTTIEMAEAITLGGGKALVVSEGGRLENELVEAGGLLIRFPAGTKNPATLLANAARLRSIIVHQGVSLVHARSRAPAWSAWLATRRKKRTFVTTYHGIYNQKGRAKALYNSVMARGDAIICNSEYTANIVRSRHADASDRIGVIYRGVDLARFNRDAVSAARIEAVRQAWGLSPGSRAVLLPARLTRWKGHETLIAAAARLAKESHARDVTYVFAGDEQGRIGYRNDLNERIEGLGLTGKVVFAGHCEDMPAAFAASAVTVVPSIEPEAFGRVSVEAQAMGCPVIVSNSGALPETLIPGDLPLPPRESFNAGGDLAISAEQQSPWIFATGDALALSRALSEVLTMPSERLQRHTERARANVQANFSKVSLQTKTLQVYDRLLGTQLTPAFLSALEKRE